MKLVTTAIALAASCAALATACSNDRSPGPSSAGPSTAPPAAPSGPPTTALPGTDPKPTPRAALEALLSAEVKGDRAASYRLIAPSARSDLKILAEWVARRTELPAVTAFTIAAEDGPKVTALVEHVPGLDPFVGLSPGKERQTWTAVPAGNEWLLDATFTSEILYPDGAGISSTVTAWIAALQSCDPVATRKAQAVDTLYGNSDKPSRLCRTTGTVAVGSVSTAPSGRSTQDLVTQYGPDALVWARSVALTATPVGPFSVILAPLGDEWLVVGAVE